MREIKVQGMERKVKEMEQKLKDQEEQLRAKERELVEQTTMLQNRNNDLDEDTIDIRSNDARRKSLQCARGTMPQWRLQFVSTTVDLVEKASPRKTAALKKAGITSRNPDIHYMTITWRCLFRTKKFSTTETYCHVSQYPKKC